MREGLAEVAVLEGLVVPDLACEDETGEDDKAPVETCKFVVFLENETFDVDETDDDDLD